MDMHSRKEYLREVQKEYLGARKIQKKKLLDEAQKRTGLDRKYLIRRLSARTRWEKISRLTGRLREYQSDLVLPLVELWDIFDEPCSQRLKPQIEQELERLRHFEEILVTDKQAEQLKKMSTKTIDRLLEHEKSVRIIEAKYTKKNNPLLYQMIPTKLSGEFDRSLIGQIQIDAVEHCGQSAAGEYLNTISTTDIASSWWEGTAVMGKGQERTLAALKLIRQRFPTKWTEIHPDNGTSFINYFLYDYTKKTNLKFSRSRPYQKNDNCFIEQQNSQKVRRQVGYVRYDTEKEQTILNDLYAHELRLYKNFFQPVMRLDIKERNKGHVYRKYQKARTPYQWLLDDPKTPDEVKSALKQQYQNLNPAALKRQIEEKLGLLRTIYAKKHQSSELINEAAIVTFSFDPTTQFRCPAHLT